MLRPADKARRRKGARTRTQIVEAAARLFSAHGYHATGIEDILNATGLTKGAFYHHFRTKQEVAVAAVEAAREDYRRYLFDHAVQQGSPGARVEGWLARVAELNAQPRWRHCLLLATLAAEMTAREEPLARAVWTLRQELADGFARLVAEGQAAGEVRRSIRPEVAAAWWLATMMGAVVVIKLGGDARDLEKILKAMGRFLVKRDTHAADR